MNKPETENEEDIEIKLSPTGSVLVPTANPYDKYQRIREANDALRNEPVPIRIALRRVHFNEEVICLEDEHNERDNILDREIADERDMPELIAENKLIYRNREQENLSSSTRVLHVTVPTCVYEESEDILSEEDIEKTSENENLEQTEKYERDDEIDESESEEIEDETLQLPGQDQVCERRIYSEEVSSEENEINDELIESFEKSFSIEEKKIHIKSDYKTLSHHNTITAKENKTGLNKKFNHSNIKINENNLDCKKFKMNPRSKYNSKSNHGIIKNNVARERKDDSLKKNQVKRRATAPIKRVCCKDSMKFKLPVYNGHRSEYGLTEEQLKERQKQKLEHSKNLRFEKEKKYLEERQRQKENDLKFNNWLVRKKREDAENTLRKLRQSSNYFIRTTTPAAYNYLDKIGVSRRQMFRRERAYFLFDDILKHVKPQKQRTYRIFLGLCIEE